MKIRVPRGHPRADCLRIRERLTEAFKKNVVAAPGLIAHGRGECFDYIIGEKTQPFALRAEETAVATLLMAEKPVISVNGNGAALCANELICLATTVKAKIEVNLFYRSLEREKAVTKLMMEKGAKEVLGTGRGSYAYVPGLRSPRGRVDKEGLLVADTVMVSIEDGDRTDALKHMGKTVIAVELNPFSRTALTASITIIDNLTRAAPRMVQIAKTLKKLSRRDLEYISSKYDNQASLSEAVNFINARLMKFASHITRQV